MTKQTKSGLRKYWKPTLATGVGGTSIVVWFEELLILGLEFVTILAVLLVTGPILLFNYFVFKSASPKIKD